MNLTKKSRLLLFACIASTALTLASLFLFDRDALTEVYRASGFGFMLVSFMCWAFMMLPREPSAKLVLGWLRQEGWVLALVLVLPALMFLVSPLQFRILEDETNLLGIANSMFSSHSFANMNDAHYYANAQHVISSHWDKRPNFYPFLIYIVHCLKGYSAYNGFVVNFVAAAASLWSLYWLLKQCFHRAVAVLGLMLLAAFPVFVLWVTSSGFEVVNLCFSLIAFCLLHRYLKTRESYNLERLVLTLLLLSQTRYESSVFALAFGLVVLFSLRRASIEKLSVRVVALPWFFLPVAWQRLFKIEKLDHQVYGDNAIFSLENFSKNMTASWDYFVGTEERYGTIGIVFYLALLGLALGIVELFRKRRGISPETWYMLAAAATSLMALGGVVFAYYWGDLTASFMIRLGIIFLPFVLFGFSYLIEVLYSSRWNRLGQASGGMLCFGVGLAFCLFYWPRAAKNEAVEQVLLNRQYQSSLAFLEREYPEHNNLIISDMPGLYSIHRWGAVSCELANKMVVQFKIGFEHQLYQNVLAIQIINYADGMASNGTELSPRYKLESVYETQYSPAAKLVISKLVLK